MKTYVQRTCDRINDSESKALFHGREVVEARVTTINGGIDEALWITLDNGTSRIAYVSEITFEGN